MMRHSAPAQAVCADLGLGPVSVIAVSHAIRSGIGQARAAAWSRKGVEGEDLGVGDEGGVTRGLETAGEWGPKVQGEQWVPLPSELPARSLLKEQTGPTEGGGKSRGSGEGGGKRRKSSSQSAAPVSVPITDPAAMEWGGGWGGVGGKDGWGGREDSRVDSGVARQGKHYSEAGGDFMLGRAGSGGGNGSGSVGGRGGGERGGQYPSPQRLQSHEMPQEVRISDTTKERV